MTSKPDYFRTFCRVSKAFAATQSRERLLELIVESAIETMDGKAACLFLEDREEDLFIPAAQKGLSSRYLHANPLKARRLMAAMKDGGYLAFPDATSDPRLERLEAKRAEGIASILSVPVQAGGRFIGALSLYTATRRDFSKEEIEFLSALAEHGGIAIQHARLLEQIRKNAGLFLSLSSNINASLDIRKILHILTAETCDVLEIKGVVIQLERQPAGVLEVVASHGVGEGVLKALGQSRDSSTQQAMGGAVVSVPSLRNDASIRFAAEAAASGVDSMLCLPIRSRDQVLGIMRVFGDEGQRYDEETVTLLKALALTGGLAIENAACYLRLEDDMKSLKEETWSHRSWF
jgi:GAF domain-containing protein